MHALVDRALFRIDIDSDEHVHVLLSVLAEVKSFLTHAGRCPLIIALVGVVVDERRRPVKLLNELADCGSLEDYIRRGWEAAAAGVLWASRFLLVAPAERGARAAGVTPAGARVQCHSVFLAVVCALFARRHRFVSVAARVHCVVCRRRAAVHPACGWLVDMRHGRWPSSHAPQPARATAAPRPEARQLVRV